MSSTDTPDPSHAPHTLARELGERAHALEHALEHAGERIGQELHAAEESIARRYGLPVLLVLRLALRTLGWLLLALFFAFGLMVLALRYWLLPDIDAMRPRIERIASAALNAPVTIVRIEASWRRLNPVLALTGVTVQGPQGSAPLTLPRIDGTLSWRSVPTLQPRFLDLRIHAPELDVVLLPDGAIAVGGIVIDPRAGRSDSNAALDWLLAQRKLMIQDAHVSLRDERSVPARTMTFTEAELLLKASFGQHRFAIRATPPSAFAAPLDLRGEFRPPPFGRKSDIRRWRGELFAQVDYVDLAQLNGWLQQPFAIRSANGALRAWVSFEDAQWQDATADLAMTGVDARLAPDLQPLQLASLQGRITRSHWSKAARGGELLRLQGVHAVLKDGAQFPPLDLSYRTTRAAGAQPPHTELTATQLDLRSVAGIATHLPLGRALRDAIERHTPSGRLTDVALEWDGAEPDWKTLAGRASFRQLSVAAQSAEAGMPGRPGFERLDGSVQLDKGGGTLRLDSSDAVLVFPGLFAEPRIPAERLQAELHWKPAEARIEALRIANAHLDVGASGTWRPSADGKGPGTADVSGRIERLDASAAYRYIPQLVGEGTLEWLRHALIAGRAEGGSFRLRGDLQHFPFRNPAEGDFRAAVRVRGGVLDVAPEADASGRRTPGRPWPLLRDIDADVLFERQAMSITAQRGNIHGVAITEATARIADLAHEPLLDVRGRTDGALTDMLAYVNTSPVAQWTQAVTANAEARGNAQLDLRLQIPLAHAAGTRVNGTLHLQGNDLTLAGVPPFSLVTGALNFDEHGVKFDNLTGGFLGGQARFDATTRGDGAIIINASGVATVEGVRAVVDQDIAQRLLDRAQGSARYSASLTAQASNLTLQADSDLIGLALDGLPPLRKATGDALPLRIEKTTRGAQDTLRASVGRVLGVHLERRQDGDTLRLQRGVVAVNEPANTPESGMLVLLTMPRLDVEAWSAWLGLDLPGEAPQRGVAADGFHVDHVALRTPDLVIGNRSFRDVTLGATRTAAGGFDVNVVSEGATGYIGWRPAPAGARGAASLGHISAQLARLVISESRTGEVVDVLKAPRRQFPSVEATVEHFEIGGNQLGRLELAAANTGTGAAAAWQLNRLAITSPDLTLTASGDWSPGPGGAQRMRVTFSFDSSDAGATLGRFGMPGAMAGGHGKLEGHLEWVGSPLAIDYPTLGGAMSLNVEDGRFMQVETRGAGRLLSLLSLQSLSRILVTDSRSSFGEGFAFDTIRADATVNRGVISTDNFTMTGASAGALMSGSVNLGNETQQLHLIVLPEIDASTAALAIGVANPIVGLGALLANMVLRAPLSRAFALEYDIGGTISDPVVTRRTRTDASPTSQENPR